LFASETAGAERFDFGVPEFAMILLRLFACGGPAHGLKSGIIRISQTTVLMHIINNQPQPERVA
jgi:hypothetical protein